VEFTSFSRASSTARHSPIRAHKAMAEGWLPFRQRDQPVEQSLDALLTTDRTLLGEAHGVRWAG